MKINLGGWTTTKVALAVAGTLAIAGAVGSAIAMSPIVQPPIKWQGGWDTLKSVASGQNNIYTVSAGKNLMVTDLIVTNQTATTLYFTFLSSTVASCETGRTLKLYITAVPAEGSTNIPFQTGLGIPGSHHVCVEATGALHVTARGFLFTAAPAS